MLQSISGPKNQKGKAAKEECEYSLTDVIAQDPILFSVEKKS